MDGTGLFVRRGCMGIAPVICALLVLLMPVSMAMGQQQIGYVDTEHVLTQLPEYATVQQKLDKLEQQWRADIKEKQEEVETLEQEFEVRELLYTEEERQRKRQEIQEARREVEQLRQRYFGPEGELFSRQKQLMRPIQERILEAAEDVATQEGYDYVVDKKGETLFLYASEEHDLSDQVLRELGITVDQPGANRPPTSQPPADQPPTSQPPPDQQPTGPPRTDQP